MLRTIIFVILGILLVIILAALAFYFWPTTSSSLQKADVKPMSYDDAVKAVAAKNTTETTSGVTSECKSTLLTHDKKTSKAVIMFHGVTACPDQYSALAKKFYDDGYNVYMPLMPYHGTTDKKLHGQITAKDLVAFTNTSTSIATGIGDDIGAIGLSGGGVVATWAAEYQSQIKHLLVLSPFYEPAASQAPKWQLPLLKRLYGWHILPDSYVTQTDFSLRALGNFLIVADNFKKNPSGLPLKNIAVVTSASDDVIDLQTAMTIPQKIADANNLKLRARELPKEWGVGHALVSPDEKGVAQRQDELFNLYKAYYEDRQP